MILKPRGEKIRDSIIIESQTIKIEFPSDHESIVVVTRQMARKVGLKTTDEYLVATAASELATNIFRYAGKGEMIISIVKYEFLKGLEIIASDNGPGIKAIDKAIEDNYTTTPKSLGMGLPSVIRIMDEVAIYTKYECGTKIITRKWS